MVDDCLANVQINGCWQNPKNHVLRSDQLLTKFHLLSKQSNFDTTINVEI